MRRTSRKIISGDGATAFQQSTATNGLVSMEAENYNAKTDRSSHAWTARDDIAGDSGPGAMQATPDNGMIITSSIASTSPELGYRVNFVKTATHYVWIRGYATVSENTSVLTGLDGPCPAPPITSKPIRSTPGSVYSREGEGLRST